MAYNRGQCNGLDCHTLSIGTDYFTRTTVAKAPISVNKPNETKYFY